MYTSGMSQHTLSQTDRHFFELVARAAFANPFGKERYLLDMRIAGGPDNLSRTQAVDASVEATKHRLAALSSRDLCDYAQQDRRFLEPAILFDVFHEFSPKMDAFVQRQLREGAASVEVPFARQMLQRLVAQGITENLAERRLSLLYQIRRAYFFIHTRLVGGAECIARLRERLWMNIFTDDLRLYDELLWNRMEDFSTFLVGETGTGKGTAAAALGYSGWIAFDGRKNRFEHSFTEAFVPINLSQFPGSLIESELFGHKKGAFTGAIEDHPGVFGRCLRQGVIFLDEIGEVDLNVQVKLLRVLQDRLFTPVGSRTAQRFNGRVVAATNRPVGELRRQGQFRDDFYYRLCSDIIEIPTLRERLRDDPGELDLLLGHIVTSMLGEAPRVVALVKEVIATQLPEDYRWPGNVRELEQCVRRVIVAREYGGDTCADTTVVEGPVAELAQKMDAETLDAKELLQEYCKILYERHGTYEEVGRRAGLDRRTVKKYVHPE